jgi:hypothetical protein
MVFIMFIKLGNLANKTNHSLAVMNMVNLKYSITNLKYYSQTIVSL